MSKATQPAVQCVYAQAGATLHELLAESFRLYLQRCLDEAEAGAAGSWA
ncbi:MAG: hypothetical protein ACI4ML_12235 [Aristaeellaceae bacterium]